MIGGRAGRRPSALILACFALASVATSTGVQAGAQAADGDAAVIALVDAFTQAQRGYDQVLLAALTTPDYAEISPVGDVDARDEMLGFYASDKKRPAPTLTISERVVRRRGDAATMHAKFAFAVPGPDGAARAVEMRAGFVARRTTEGWKLAAAQYTPIPPRSR